MTAQESRLIQIGSDIRSLFAHRDKIDKRCGRPMKERDPDFHKEFTFFCNHDRRAVALLAESRDLMRQLFQGYQLTVSSTFQTASIPPCL